LSAIIVSRYLENASFPRCAVFFEVKTIGFIPKISPAGVVVFVIRRGVEGWNLTEVPFIPSKIEGDRIPTDP